MGNGVRDWLEERTGLPSTIRHFLDEDIPASAGWHQVLGSVALFAFLIQVATGILLALNYGPTPSDAHASIRYIMTELTAGPMIRGLHHWGASCMIVVVVLHMMQVFVWGAYKKPREATWIAGCALLLLTLAFGLTGYLLPWDNKAYWGTTVTTQIMGLAPGVGPYLKRLLGADNDTVGTITFARFYTGHVILLPLATTLLIGIHLYLVRRHGVTPAAADAGKPSKKFYPEQVFKDSVATFGYVMVLVLFANFAKLGLGQHGGSHRHPVYSASRMVFSVSVPDAEVFPGPAGGAGRGDSSEPGHPGAVPGAVPRPRPGDPGPPANRGHRAHRVRRDRMGRLDGARRGDDAAEHGGSRRRTETSAAVARNAAGAARGDRIFRKATTARAATCWGGRWPVRIWRRIRRPSPPTG